MAALLKDHQLDTSGAIVDETSWNNENIFILFNSVWTSIPSCLPFVFLPSAEFSRESLLEAAGGLECPLTKEKEDCFSVASVADPLSQQNNAQAGT